MKVLIIDENEQLAADLALELEKHRFVIDVASNKNDGLELIARSSYVIVLLDSLPDELAVCKQIRKQDSSISILVIIEAPNKLKEIQCLDAGADEIVIKPFDVDVLSARIRALTRRSVGTRVPELICGPLAIDTASSVVKNSSTIIALTPTEYRLLLIFAQNPSRFFNSEELVDNLWSTHRAPGKAAVKTHMKTLRKKLSNAGVSEDLIESMYGYGYRLKPNAWVSLPEGAASGSPVIDSFRSPWNC